MWNTRLALDIVLYMIGCYENRDGVGQGIPLSDYRKIMNVPSSTFYSVVGVMVESGIIKRNKRDRYMLGDVFNNILREV